jgi:hypothetical protein
MQRLAMNERRFNRKFSRNSLQFNRSSIATAAALMELQLEIPIVHQFTEDNLNLPRYLRSDVFCGRCWRPAVYMGPVMRFTNLESVRVPKTETGSRSLGTAGNWAYVWPAQQKDGWQSQPLIGYTANTGLNLR